MLTYIDINKIYPHPNNPRQELGDLTELAESIKVSGILQNLTVVPRLGQNIDNAGENEYTAIIGHRRLAAAKLAGLAEVPCSIVNDMDEKTQVATMLLENIQRSDLTIWEQAQGFQMMLDFGETVNTISEKTGFSQTTIRRRMKLLDLDREKLKESVNRGATLFDYAELDKIKDIELKNRVLEKIGTPNFKYELSQALDKETKDENKALISEELEKFAQKVADTKGLKYVDWFSHNTSPDIKRPDDADTVKYYFISSQYNTQLFRENTSDEVDAKQLQQEKERKLTERRARLDEINNRAFKLRLDFIMDYKSTKKHAKEIMAFAVQTMMEKGWSDVFGSQIFFKMLGIEPDTEDEKKAAETVLRTINAAPERALLIAAYCNSEDSARLKYYGYDCKFSNDDNLDFIYEFLEKLGYEMSDEERALYEGTHELFIRDNIENNQITEPPEQIEPMKAAS